MVVSELRGEKIDIIPWNDEPARFIAKALSPARVKEVLVDDESMQATVIVPEDNLALAIGREGQNARLAARLTGWRIDIRSAADFDAAAHEQSDGPAAPGEMTDDGRCQAVLKTGKRCPNSVEGSEQFCSLHEGWVPTDVPEGEPDAPDAQAAVEIEAEAVEVETDSSAVEPVETAGVAAADGDAEGNG
jgi:N utilization substance protein A